jgi:uncharacterized metal-binding protein
MHHRSVFSHGPIIGTTLRVLYLASWMALLGLLGLGVVQLFRDVPWSWQQFSQDVRRSLISYRGEWIALFVGLELGAMSHSLSDWINSAYKRSKRKSKRTSTSRKRTASRRTSKK